jgi:pimeloyl-ACP methyl ester carboxylesterase
MIHYKTDHFIVEGDNIAVQGSTAWRNRKTGKVCDTGLNTPLPADFRDQIGRLTTPVERYVATRVPTLFLTSEEDGLIWPELSQKVHEHVPGSHFERVGAAGHSTYFEGPDVFNREVGVFLKEHRP